MSIGNKIRTARKEKKMTQSTLAGNKITRNMLSAIECGKATPSLDTLYHIAETLELPVAYFISEEEDLFVFKKNAQIKKIRSLYAQRSYEKCISVISSLGTPDSELAYLLAQCHFELGRRAVTEGSLKAGGEHLDLALKFSEQTVYDTERIKALSLLYSALRTNIKSPLLEFDGTLFRKSIEEYLDYGFYKYLVGDESYEGLGEMYSKHFEAKRLMRERRYEDALNVLKEIESLKTPENYNAYLIFGVYSDIENCYKQLADFENAYRYSTKRISLIEGFNN